MKKSELIKKIVANKMAKGVIGCKCCLGNAQGFAKK